MSISFTSTPTTSIYTLSLHDALPIFLAPMVSRQRVMAAQVFDVDDVQAALHSPARHAFQREEPVAGEHVLLHERIGARRRSEEQRLNSSHVSISYAVFCLKKKNIKAT